MSQSLNVRVIERGADSSDSDAPEAAEVLTLRQSAAESNRTFTHRVAARLSQLTTRGVRIARASLHLAPARSGSAMARRFGLARVILSQLPTFEASELFLGGALAETPAGQLDLSALRETLGIELRGSRTVVRTAPVKAAPAFSVAQPFAWQRTLSPAH